MQAEWAARLAAALAEASAAQAALTALPDMAANWDVCLGFSDGARPRGPLGHAGDRLALSLILPALFPAVFAAAALARLLARCRR
jgi:hypothetical protein